MTAGQMVRLIGKVATWEPQPGIRFNVLVVDARQRFGTIDLQIHPLDGEGTKWVERDSVRIQDSV